VVVRAGAQAIRKRSAIPADPPERGGGAACDRVALRSTQGIAIKAAPARLTTVGDRSMALSVL
jgi:hypothetical protein